MVQQTSSCTPAFRPTAAHSPIAVLLKSKQQPPLLASPRRTPPWDALSCSVVAFSIPLIKRHPSVFPPSPFRLWNCRYWKPTTGRHSSSLDPSLHRPGLYKAPREHPQHSPVSFLYSNCSFCSREASPLSFTATVHSPQPSALPHHRAGPWSPQWDSPLDPLRVEVTPSSPHGRSRPGVWAPASSLVSVSQSPRWAVLLARFTVFIDPTHGVSYWKSNPKFSKF
jgi:hypothetical protein